MFLDARLMWSGKTGSQSPGCSFTCSSASSASHLCVLFREAPQSLPRLASLLMWYCPGVCHMPSYFLTLTHRFFLASTPGSLIPFPHLRGIASETCPNLKPYLLAQTSYYDSCLRERLGPRLVPGPEILPPPHSSVSLKLHLDSISRLPVWPHRCPRP